MRIARCLLAVVLTGTPAAADVYGTCAIPRCADAREAADIWRSKGSPAGRGWYRWPDGRYNFSGGRFGNREGQLPPGGRYSEYDVYSRRWGAARDEYRLVIDRGSGRVWFSPDHYDDVHLLATP
ncbi:ribonuclease N [Spongiactinospora gelatinilytica]|uniref:Ribonuclease N n=1 Tax=Spongiactinospora gelatinilytica TaxID=2666298 RepID=A0A2W2GVT8_9ACTN|nr:ribonuclease domain-containing protein [Spongiactinospora gelatinilytica]PZG52042.1 ribonuclease N [Spongiactinospora gelatinilytica]